MFRDKQGNTHIRREAVIGLVVAILLVVWVVFLSVYTVPAGFVGVVTRFGAVQRIVQPGFRN